MRPIIEAQGLSKSYQLGATGGYNSLRELLSQLVRRKRATEPFWALNDVSFSITPGEAVGIIGRNGAGKSTLLKILSRITAPTRGEARLRGRVAALLEVGTGFHSELSGRENIFLNGAIMGMTRPEIRRCFDEIVAFAEIEKFLDTPVKRYSSGMYVRLAFAVAAHLRPEILIVDEVLAVGDAAFQKKCLGKMQDVASGGRTVLFVSHNLAAITRLCTRGILLRNGQVVSDGRIDRVVTEYMRGDESNPVAIDYVRAGKVPGNEHVRLLRARVEAPSMDNATVDIGASIRIELDYEVLRGARMVHPAIQLDGEDGSCAFVTNDSSDPGNRIVRAPGRYRAHVQVPPHLLAEGMYSVSIALWTFDPAVVHVHERGALAFHVAESGDGASARGMYAGPIPGVVRPLLPWTTVMIADEREAESA